MSEQKVFKCFALGTAKSCQLKSNFQCPHVGEHFEIFGTEGKKKGKSLCLCCCGEDLIPCVEVNNIIEERSEDEKNNPFI